MELIFEKINKKYRIKIVKVSRKPEELFDSIRNDLNKKEIQNYRSIKNSKRKTEWLTARILLKQILGKYSEIKYDLKGNPFTEDDFHISITHSQNFVGIIISKDPYVGIDSEIISYRILRTAHKFISDDELKQFDQAEKLKKIYLNWCGKETLYKIKGGGGLDFIKDLKIIITQIKTSGKIRGIIKDFFEKKEFEISYSFIEIKNQELLITWHSS